MTVHSFARSKLLKIKNPHNFSIIGQTYFFYNCTKQASKQAVFAHLPNATDEHWTGGFATE